MAGVTEYTFFFPCRSNSKTLALTQLFSIKGLAKIDCSQSLGQDQFWSADFGVRLTHTEVIKILPKRHSIHGSNCCRYPGIKPCWTHTSFSLSWIPHVSKILWPLPASCREIIICYLSKLTGTWVRWKTLEAWAAAALIHQFANKVLGVLSNCSNEFFTSYHTQF